MRIEQSALH